MTPVFVALKPTGEVIVPGLLFKGIISPWRNTWPRHSCTPITSSTTHQLRAAQRTAVTNSLSPWQNPCPIHLCAPFTSSSELQTPPPGVLLSPWQNPCMGSPVWGESSMQQEGQLRGKDVCNRNRNSEMPAKRHLVELKKRNHVFTRGGGIGTK